MNKKLYSLFVILILMFSAFYACDSDDNNYNYEMSPEWIAFNDSVYDVIRDSAEMNSANDPLLYRSRACLTGNGNIYYKTIDEFEMYTPKSLSEISPKISAGGYPYFNDSVFVRYEGWYYYKDTETGETKKYIFDSTEREDDGYNKKPGVGFRINNGLVAGFATTLQYMKVGDQVQICIPYNLAYGEYSVYNNGSLSMYGHTTLFFKLLMVRIYPVNPDEFPGVDTGQ